jgi:C4-dicarboxylate-specific signal transduction histidine kinase
MSFPYTLSRTRPFAGERLRDAFAAARSGAAAYGAALILVGAAAGLTPVLHLLHIEDNRFQFYAAVAASAWLGGAGPGCMAVVLATLAVEYFFTAPFFNLRVYAHELPEFLAFVTCAAVSAAVCARLRQAEHALMRGHQRLEAAVAQRTTELREMNLALTAEIGERERADRERAVSETALAETQAQLARVLRMATVAECAAVAHEVNQPLAAIAANAGACLRSLEGEPPALDLARKAAAGIVSDSQRASAVVSRIGALLRNRKPTIAALDINAVIGEVLGLIRSTAEKEGVAIRTSLCRTLPAAAGDAVYLQQVLLNLATNAVEAMRGIAERPRVLAVRSRRNAAGDVQIEMEDSGPGLDVANPDRIFESFYTTKAEGLGMGLSISQSIVTAHGGRLWAAPARRHGAVFRFTVPVAAAPDA